MGRHFTSANYTNLLILRRIFSWMEALGHHPSDVRTRQSIMTIAAFGYTTQMTESGTSKSSLGIRILKYLIRDFRFRLEHDAGKT